MRDIVEIKKIPDWPRIRQFPGYLQNLPSAQECRKNDSLPLIVLKIAYWSLTCQDLRISWGCVKKSFSCWICSANFFGFPMDLQLKLAGKG
jgi:hypothetical protein